MLSQIKFEIPLLPPSVNHYKQVARWVRGGQRTTGFFVTKEAKAFIEAVCILSGKQAAEGKYFDVSIAFHVPEKEFLRWDVDNFSKVSCDALKAAGVIPDDRYISDLHLHKLPAQDQQSARTAYLIQGREQLTRGLQ